MSGINLVQGGPDRSTLSSRVGTDKASPADIAKAKQAVQVKRAKLALQAKKLQVATDAKRAAQAAALKTASGTKGAGGPKVDVYA